MKLGVNIKDTKLFRFVSLYFDYYLTLNKATVKEVISYNLL